MRIDKALNLVCPVETETGLLYVHSTPIGLEVFERFFLIVSKTFSQIYSEGLSFLAGPRVAAMMLKKLAIESGCWEGANGVEGGLMAEITRLSNVITPTDAGWKTVPLYDAVQRGVISAEDLNEAMGYIVFFICTSAMHKRSNVPEFLDGMAAFWGTQSTLLNCTEYAASLPTSSETEISAVPEPEPASMPMSSIPH